MSSVALVGPDDREIVAQALVASWEEFFAENGQTAIAVSESLRWEGDSLAASLGYAGERCKGSLLVIAPVSVFSRTHPNPTRRESLTDEELCDWAGETANQLLGRIKQRLLSRGLDFRISTPTVLRGEHVTRMGESKTLHRLWGEVDGQPMQLAIDVTNTSSEPLFSLEPVSGAEAIDGGDLVLL